MKKISTSKITAALLIAMAAVTVVLNTVMYFFLPDKLQTQISCSGTSSGGMSSPVYLIGSALLIGLAAGMSLFGGGSQDETEAKRKQAKWIFVEAVLFVANVAAIIINAI